jgi:putative ABC transport system substrate-binding protein
MLLWSVPWMVQQMQFDRLKRREFITLLATTAMTWPRTLAAQSIGARRIGVLMELAADDPQARSNVAALQRGLYKLGWSQGSNLGIDYRWAPDDPVLVWKFAKELVELQPEVIVAHSSPVVQPCWGRPATFPLYLCRSPTPLARASSRASPIPVGTSPDLRISNRQ